ncbi:YidH family protein [Variovorax sp. GT1P44]|uniref:YidH family protein n=1 Tax=Variovorax sp. GT1P44 TaxID=3443742 RepID=UPI003F4676D0
MKDGPTTTPPPEKTSAQINTDLAVDRTVMAADRTLMAWVRTALSMTSFGFTIYKVIEGFQHDAAHTIKAEMPRDVGLFLTGLGTVAMVMGTIEYWLRIKELQHNKPLHIMQPSFVMALIMSVAALFIFVGIAFRLL